MINTLQKRPQSKSYKTRLEQAPPLIKNNNQQQAEKCFQMGKEHQNRKDIQKAQKFYLEAIIHNPAHFKSYCNLGLCYKIRGQYPNSIEAYKKSLAINSSDAITNYNLANVYRLIGDQQRSISHYHIVIDLKEKQGVDVNSLYLDSYNNLGICYKNIENYSQAIACFEKIMKEKPSDESVKFNLAVCYLRATKKMIKDPKNQNLMLIKENISKTKTFFHQVLKKEPSNQVATLALIELQCLSKPQNQNLKKCLSQLDQLLQKPEASRFLKEEGSKVKAYCLSMLKKYEESAQEYRKAAQKKKQEEERKLKEQMEKQKALLKKEKQEMAKKTQSTKAVDVNKVQPVLQPTQTAEKITPPNQKITQPVEIEINPKEVFGNILSALLQKIKNLLENPNTSPQTATFLQNLQTTIEDLSKQHLPSIKDKKLTQRIKKQLNIVGCSILGEKLIDKEYLIQAYNTYFDYFLQSNPHTQITKSTLFLETHRAIASVLTSLGESQKAIEHYQIISQQFAEENIHDKDPLQELHSGLAVNYESQGLHEKAIKEFEQAIRLNPKNYILYYNLGYCQHCAGLNAQAIQSYSKFLEEIEKETTLEAESKQSYILQALMSIFVCSDESTEAKLSKFSKVQAKIEEFCHKDFQNLLKLVDSQALMHYYLLACDLHEEIIFNLQKSPKQASKQHKEKLFIIYINLLELPNCPDRDQILINCGNLLFEERQFFGALQFYEKVSKSKKEVFNIIALTRMNINEHEKAISCMEFAIQCDKNNKIYETNFEIMKWAYSLEVTNPQNLLWTKYQCQCDLEFDTRVEYAKSLITKLTSVIEHEISQGFQIEQSNIQSFFSKILSENEEAHLWREPETLLKHNTLKKHIYQHCHKVHNDGKQQFIETTQVKDILELVVQQTQKSEQTISKSLDLLISKLNDPNLKSCSDYLNVLQQIFGSYIFSHAKDQNKMNNLKQVLSSRVQNTKTYDLTFSDSVVSSSTQYPSKTFATLYPSIQLKLENILQTILSWETLMEEQYVYLLKIVESVAYKSQLKSPVLVDYNFPSCKNLENCDKCSKKACFVLSKLLNIDCKQNFINSLSENSSLETHKKALHTAFANKFGKNLQPLLKPSLTNDAQTLTFTLSEDTLPLQMQITFLNETEFDKFLKELCAELSVNQPTVDKSHKQLYLTLNKLIRVRCMWKDTDFTEEMIASVARSPLGLKQSAIELFDSELLREWVNQPSIKPLLQKVFNTETFLQ